MNKQTGKPQAAHSIIILVRVEGGTTQEAVSRVLGALAAQGFSDYETERVVTNGEVLDPTTYE